MTALCILLEDAFDLVPHSSFTCPIEYVADIVLTKSFKAGPSEGLFHDLAT
jgi:hypothetical protein